MTFEVQTTIIWFYWAQSEIYVSMYEWMNEYMYVCIIYICGKLKLKKTTEGFDKIHYFTIFNIESWKCIRRGNTTQLALAL